MLYHVEWEIEVEAESTSQAARKARDIQIRSESEATVFKVYDEEGGHQSVDVGNTLERLKAAHDCLSEAIENPSQGLGSIRRAAVNICEALNAFYEEEKANA